MRNWLFASVAAAALSAPVCGFAQEAAADGPTTTLDEIVVTGEKVERSLQDTETSVAVITSRRLEVETLQSLQELYTRTANVSETYGSYGFTIRGVANQGVSGGGDAPLSTVYIDGAPIPQNALFSGVADLWDARQVEIFRGPQSTLQGLNALAGAVVIRTEDPTMDWSGRARVLYADVPETTVSVAGGGPVVSDTLAFRLAVEHRDSEGFVYNTTRDEPESPIDSTMVRGKLLFTPASIPPLRAQLAYTHFENEGGYLFTYVRTDTPDFRDRRVATNDAPNAAATDYDQVGLELSYDLSDRLTLSSVTSYGKLDQFQTYDGDGGPQSLTFGFTGYDFETFTQEVRLAFDTDRLRGLVGAFYYNRQQDLTAASRTDVPTPGPTISLLLQGGGLDEATADFVAGLYVAALPVIPVSFTLDSPSEVETAAVFADGEFDLTDRMTLVGGARYDRETNAIENTQVATFVGTLPDQLAFGPAGSGLFLAVSGINAGVLGLVEQASGAAPPASRDFEAFLPKLGVRYDWSDDVSTAFVVQRGYRSGGSSVNTARAAAIAYDPEYTWNYEASLRSVWLYGHLVVNANAYYVDWTDQQVQVNFGLNAYDFNTVNAGKSHLYGFEVESSLRISDAFDVYGSVGFARTKFDEFTTDVAGTESDYSGQEFAYAPRWTLAAGANYRWASGFSANLNASYRSSTLTDVGFTNRIDARTLVNGRVGYETDRWGLFVFAKNLLDEDYETYDRRETNQAVLGDPRVLGVTLEARW